ncbi:unnamed protein product [Peronospora destructor]|uniref:Chromo domain-containing protein n=1 Tax=Peronospora destructor TaxID=86335 RepID=A0AAV0TQX6_9STRA|nr:unnamed protein product [Peronospora destructor]
MAYRPQANGIAERMVQTITRSIKIYVSEVDQRDWDAYAERLTFALNTAQDRVRQETPFYLVHGWDARSTLEATIPLGSTKRLECEPRRWRYGVQRQYRRARERVNERLRSAMEGRVQPHNEDVSESKIEAESQVWLFLDRVKEGYARKLAHLWHGPFRVLELVGDHAARLDISGTDYRIYPLVHLSKLKLVRQYPDRPSTVLVVDETDRVDFDESLLPEDSWATGLEEDEYEVEKILEMRTGRKTRYGRIQREYLVQWKGYPDPSWVDEVDLNCGGLLRDYDRRQITRNRFEAMQSHEE